MGNKMANVAAGQVYKSNISGKLFTVLEVQDSRSFDEKSSKKQKFSYALENFFVLHGQG